MDTKNISKRVVSGFISLTFRRVILLAINFATINLLLARILPVSTIGIFNIANAILSFFTFFSDIGLAAAIIQKREISQEDLKTTFTIQEILALLITLVVWFSAPFLASLYNLDINGMWLIRALGLGFLLTSLKVIPSVLLERELKFQPLVWVEILETAVFNGLLILFVYRGMQVEAFSIATVARSLTGVAIIYLIAPWRIAFGFSKNAARSLLSFGVPFQANSLLALLKDRLVPLVIARMVGSVGVGYISWSQGLAFLPLEVMNIIIRVTFPAYSRLQDDHETLRVAIDKSLFLTTLFVYPLLFGLMAIMPSLVAHVVSSKWQPAVPLFYLFCFSTFWATLSTTFTNVLNAVGKINITLKLMVMWTVLTWVLSPLLTLYYGFTGAAIASALISFTSIIPVIIIRNMFKIEIIKNIWK
ncbi:oligosaccharide flippase family protein, partial [Candidatus Daviesbacteria bacterium]|nr:oligosaccharide flippase family protein [Candidatus Daviesbacteria bacterium]